MNTGNVVRQHQGTLLGATTAEELIDACLEFHLWRFAAWQSVAGSQLDAMSLARAHTYQAQDRSRSAAGV